MSGPVCRSNRRTLLAVSIAAATASLTPSVNAAIVASKSATIAVTQHPLMRVRMEIDVKGNVITPGKDRPKLPVTSKAALDYEERMLMPPGADETSEIVASERYYHTATSNSLLNKTATKQDLRDAMRHALVRRESLPETIYSPENYFTHGELSLLKSPISSVSVDLLLPGRNVIEGDRYEIDRYVLCSVLNLTSIESGKVESTVAEVTPDAVRFKIEGQLEGTVDGVSTKQRMIGKMTFNRESNTCTWLALAVHETREIGQAEPGFDVTATIRMVRRPMDAVVALPPKPAVIDFQADTPLSRMYVELQSRELEIGTMMDRRWRMISDRPGAAVMRMIENDISIAQCNIRPLVALPEGKELTQEAFEADVRATLGDQLTRLVEGDHRTTAQGLQVLRVVADGETQGIPIRWIMMHFSDEAGRRVQATFTLSADKVEAFAANDVQFADSLRFLDVDDVHDGKPPSEDQAIGHEVAKREPLDEISLSPSDLR